MCSVQEAEIGKLRGVPKPRGKGTERGGAPRQRPVLKARDPQEAPVGGGRAHR